MARIPSYTSRSSAITTSGIARARSIPFRDFEGAGMIQLGQQLGKIAESFNEAAEN